MSKDTVELFFSVGAGLCSSTLLSFVPCPHSVNTTCCMAAWGNRCLAIFWLCLCPGPFPFLLPHLWLKNNPVKGADLWFGLLWTGVLVLAWWRMWMKCMAAWGALLTISNHSLSEWMLMVCVCRKPDQMMRWPFLSLNSSVHGRQ